MNHFFKLQERGTTVSTEFLAGLTTYLTMVYIVIVNPAILSDAGMDFNAVFIATIITSMLATLIMGLFANYPIAIAPGMGLNAYFTYTIVKGNGVPWQVALGAVLVAGILFVLLSVTNFRNILINAIPKNLKYAITAGIGLFISFIGLQHAEIVVDSPATLVTIGDFSKPMTLLSIIGLTISLILMAYNIKGSLFIGMIITFLLAWISGHVSIPETIFAMPTGLSKTAFQMDLGGIFEHGLYTVIFTFLLITLFDTTGTMLGVAEQAGLMRDGEFPRARSAFLADAFGATFGALMGTSPTTAYIESTSGVAVGGKTGLTAVFVSILMLVTLFFAPIAQLLASIPAVTAPALIIVGFFMMNGLRKIDWHDLEDAFPAFLVIVTMPLTYSIATGIGIGFIVYPVLKVIRGKAKEVHPILFLFAVLFFIQLVFLSH
ncbi:NCS2 family permease [Tepidibacillus infernus]|uniref:NCS2 family permease n=1 Tax=Tepidibacillus TaxID=1494427 RepID=UPI000853B050|nr:NCS2 family permease [Tepidibacillus sp. HK-1]GBF12131.1 guanine/hypoxanthine permease PbuO [Tepidibacillus sp. HK-1]